MSVRFPSWPGFAAWVRRHPRRAILVLIVGLAIGAALGHFGLPAVSANAHWQNATAALDEQDFARAQEHLAAYLAIYPTSAAGHFLLAVACRRAGDEDLRRAERHLKRAAELGWPPKEVELESALLRFQRSGTPGQEETAAIGFLASRPDRQALILEALARGCMRADRLVEANEWLNRWVKEHPDDLHARRWRAALYQHMGNAVLAVADYREVVRRRPGDAWARRSLGLALAASGLDYREAREHLEWYLAAEGDDADCRIALAQCLRVLQELDRAEALLKEVLKNDPRHAEALLALAELQVDQQRDEEALRTLYRLEQTTSATDPAAAQEQLLRLRPVAHNAQRMERQARCLNLKAGILRRLGRRDEIDRCVAELRRLRADELALAKLLQEHRSRPQDVDVLLQIGEIYRRSGEPKAAEIWWLRATEISPVDSRAHRALAEYYRSLNTPEARQKAARHERLAGGV